MTHSPFFAASRDPERGAFWFAALLDAAGDGAHEFDILTQLDDCVVITSMILLGEGATREADEETEPLFREHLAALASGAYSGMVLLRTHTGAETAREHSWLVTEGELEPFSAAMLAEIGVLTQDKPGVTITYADAPEFRTVLNLGDEATERGKKLLITILDAAGDGNHVLTIGTGFAGLPLSCDLKMRLSGFTFYTNDIEEIAYATGLLSVIATGRDSGAMILRTNIGADTEQVCGWTAEDGKVTPRTRAEIFNDFCTDDIGEPTPPEPGVDYRDAPSLPIPPLN